MNKIDDKRPPRQAATTQGRPGLFQRIRMFASKPPRVRAIDTRPEGSQATGIIQGDAFLTAGTDDSKSGSLPDYVLWHGRKNAPQSALVEFLGTPTVGGSTVGNLVWAYRDGERFSKEELTRKAFLPFECGSLRHQEDVPDALWPGMGAFFATENDGDEATPCVIDSWSSGNSPRPGVCTQDGRLLVLPSSATLFFRRYASIADVALTHGQMESLKVGDPLKYAAASTDGSFVIRSAVVVAAEKNARSGAMEVDVRDSISGAAFRNTVLPGRRSEVLIRDLVTAGTSLSETIFATMRETSTFVRGKS